jgi:uncharacterized surface protein with fasciclin (FAS1) repeats
MRLHGLVLGGLLAALVGGTASAQQRGNNDIIVTLRNAGNFTVFLRAIEGAGLTQELKSGEYTVFAPTDDAFGRVPGTRRDSLLRDPASLTTLVRNHVVEGRVTAQDIRTRGAGVSFLGGRTSKVDVNGQFVRINGAQIIRADLAASNGLIQVIDQVWVPPLRVVVKGTNPADSAERASSPPR